MSAQVRPVAAADAAELRMFEAFCHRCGRNPLDWSVQTRRQFRKAIRRCRKCCRQGGAR